MEVNINEYLYPSLYMGCKIKPVGRNEESIDHLIKYIASSNYPAKCEIGEIVGVKSELSKEWVRGRIERTVGKTEFKVLLIDEGKYELVKKTQIVSLPEQLKYPAEMEVFGLDGVVPIVNLCRACVSLLEMTMVKGPAYFTEKRRLHNIAFGDITIKPRGKADPINLTSFLLSKELVRVSNDFHNDINKAYGLDEVYDSNTDKKSSEASKLKFSEEKEHRKITTSTSVIPSRGNPKQERCHIRSKEYSSGSSQGYLSSRNKQCDREECRNRVEPARLTVPAGYHPPSQNKHKKKNNEQCEFCDFNRYYLYQQNHGTKTDTYLKIQKSSNCKVISLNEDKFVYRPKLETWGDNYQSSENSDSKSVRAFVFRNKLKTAESTDSHKNKCDLSEKENVTDAPADLKDINIDDPVQRMREKLKNKSKVAAIGLSKDVNDKYQHQKGIIDVVRPSEEELQDLDKCNVSPFLMESEKKAVLESLNAQGILVYSSSGRIVRPCFRSGDVNLDPSIKKWLDCYLRELNRVQRISFPAIVANQNVAMIAPKLSGKTSGYVVPLASCLLHPERYLQFRTGNGPYALIICANWRAADYVANMFQQLTTCITTVLTYGGGAELEKKVDLLTGCHVLVSTPRCILRLLDYGVTNLKRLYHIVFDDADILFDKFKPEMEQLFSKLEALQQERERKGPQVHLQAILTASQWSPPVQELVTQYMVNVTLCISHVLEACVYARIRPVAAFMKSDKKIDKLLEILTNLDGQKRAVVMCNKKEDVQFVYNTLHESDQFNLLVAHEDLAGYSISDLPAIWHKNSEDEVWKDCQMSLPTLIRSDEVLEEVPVSNARVLIHYNMPNSLKTFSLRFSCLLNNFPNIFKNERLVDKDCEVYILVDEDNDLELPGIMDLMKRLKTAMPESIVQALEKIEHSKEEKKIYVPVCENVKQFGECCEGKRCFERHVLNPAVDHIDNRLPKTGYVKILVTHVHNTCHYSARILEYSTNLPHWQKLNEDRSFRTMMTKHFDVMRNRKLHASPSVGDMVAIESTPGIFDRAIIMKITGKDKKNQPSSVDIRLIDVGKYYSCGVSLLYHLPEDMRTAPPSVVDVYLCGLSPTDCDTSWGPATTHWVMRLFRQLKRDSPQNFIQGKIQLSVGRNLWLDPVECYEYLPSMDTTVFKSSLRKDLLDNNNAIENPGHITKLRNLCQKAGIQLPEVVGEERIKKCKQAKSNWAWLPQEGCEEVNVISVSSPEIIFVSITKFGDCLQKLESELQEFANSQPSIDNKSTLDIGDVCLHKTKDDVWNRALIRGKPSTDEVSVFYVDYGDIDTASWADIVPISDELITKLPFQAIECHLAGVQFSKGNDCNNDIVNEIVNLTRTEDDFYNDLLVKVCDLEPVGTIAGGRRYSVILFDPFKGININNELISKGVGQFMEDRDFINNCKELTNTAANDGGNVDDVNINDKAAMANVKAIAQVNSKQTEGNIVLSSDYKGTAMANVKAIAQANSKQTDGNIVLSSDYNVNEEMGNREQETLLKFLNSLEDYKFDVSYLDFDRQNSNRMIENDIDESGGSLSLREKTPLEAGHNIVKYHKTPKYQDSPFSNTASSSCLSTVSSTNDNALEICQAQSNKHYVDDNTLASTSVVISLDRLHVPDPSPTLQGDEEQCQISKWNSIIERSIAPQAQSSPITDSPTINEKSIDISSSFTPKCPSRSSTNYFSKNLNLVEKVKPFLEHVSTSNVNQYVFKNLNPVLGHNPEDIVKQVNLSKSNNSDTLDLDQCGMNSMISDSLGEPNHLHTSTGTFAGFVDSHLSQDSFVPKTPIRNEILSQKLVKSDTFCKASKQELEECSDNNKLVLINESPINLELRKPSVKWHQSDDYVWLLVNLPDVKEYTFHCDVSVINFRAVHNNIEYGFNIELWGAHRKETALSQPKGLLFEIKLEKMLKGMKKYKWPRLTKTEEKLPWLKLNIEKECEIEDDSEDEDIKRHALSLPYWNEDCSDTESENSMFAYERDDELFLS